MASTYVQKTCLSSQDNVSTRTPHCEQTYGDHLCLNISAYDKEPLNNFHESCIDYLPTLYEA